MKKQLNLFKSLFFRYLLGIIILYWLTKTNQLNFSTLSSVDVSSAFIALALCVLQLILSAWRVKLLLSVHRIDVSLSQCTLYNAVGIFYSTLLPGGMSGDAVRAYYFWRSNQSKGSTKSALIGTLVTDRLLGTIAMLFVGLIATTISANALGISLKYMVVIWGGFFFGIALYTFICNMHKSQWKTLKNNTLNIWLERLQRVLSKLDLTEYPNKVLIFSTFLSVIIHISSVLVIYIFAVKLKSGLDFGQIMAIAPIGLLINAIPVSPGGLGVGESGFDILFSLIGGRNGGNVFLLSRVFLFSPAILGALFSAYRLFFHRKTSNEIELDALGSKL